MTLSLARAELKIGAAQHAWQGLAADDHQQEQAAFLTLHEQDPPDQK